METKERGDGVVTRGRLLFHFDYGSEVEVLECEYFLKKRPENFAVEVIRLIVSRNDPAGWLDDDTSGVRLAILCGCSEVVTHSAGAQ
jgi:hypothetical protein